MTLYSVAGLAAIALLFALFALLTTIRYAKALKASESHHRWIQTQLERLENEQGSIESALAGLGRHMDGLDLKQTQQSQRLEHMETRFESQMSLDEGDRGFGHAVRLSAQGRVSLQELVHDFGLSESEAQLLLRINAPKS